MSSAKSTEKLLKSEQNISAFNVDAHLQYKFQTFDKPIASEHTVIVEKLPNGTEVIIEIPPVLSRNKPNFNIDNRIMTPFLIMENQIHLQCKQNNQTEAKKDYKDGTGDFCFFIHFRLSGLFTFTINCVFDGLSAASPTLWQKRLKKWNKKNLKVANQEINLQNPDVAFSQIIRHFFNSSNFKIWLELTEVKLKESIIVDLRQKDFQKKWKKYPPEIDLQSTKLIINEHLSLLLRFMGEFRSRALKDIPLNELEDSWYINAIFGLTSNLIVEPLIRFEFDEKTHPKIVGIKGIPVLSSNLRSRADIVAHSGDSSILTNEDNAKEFMRNDAWFEDGNAQTDQLIYQLRHVSNTALKVLQLLEKITNKRNIAVGKEIINLLNKLIKSEEEIEIELLRKPWRTYAVLPLYEMAYRHLLEATTHLSAKINRIYENQPLISIAATDGATTTTRDPNQRESDSWSQNSTIIAINSLIIQAIEKTSAQLGDWLEAERRTADDRTVQDQMISLKPNISKKAFNLWKKEQEKYLPNFFKKTPIRKGLEGVK